MVQTISKPSFSWEFMTAFRSKPYSVIFILLLSSLLCFFLVFCFIRRSEIWNFVNKNKYYFAAWSSSWMASPWMFTDVGSLFIDQCTSQLGVNLFMDRSASTEEAFWQCKCHMAPICFSKATLCSHMSRIFVEKNQMRENGVSLCDFVVLWLGAYLIALFL